MALVTPTWEKDLPGNTHMHSWALLTADSTGIGVQLPGAADRTVQFIGTNWGGSTAVLEGSLDSTNGTDGTWASLTDPQGNAISKTADGLEAVTENVMWVRARLSVVGTAAVVAAKLMSRSTMARG